MAIQRIAVLTSGGDSPGMNAAIRAVVRTGLARGLEVYGVRHGYQGLVDGEFVPMDSVSVSDMIQRGGTGLFTARSKDFMTEEGFRRALMMLESFKIDGLIVIGGDGSLRGALDLAQNGIAVAGLPGTIDNDLAYTDYTIGFDTAVNTAVSAIGNLRDTSSAHGMVTIVELMGRHCGDIALFAGIASGGDIIVVPEKEYDMDDICRQAVEGRNAGKLHCLIIVAEGAPFSCAEIREAIQERTGMESRITVLGHVQRGGSPSAFDRLLASRLGAYGVDALAEGKKAIAVGIRNNEIFDMDLAEALEMKRPERTELIRLGEILR